METNSTQSSHVSPSERRVTLRDIAIATRLSVASVSMALHGGRNVSAKTMARVKAVADTLGYRPDPTLSALASYRTKVRAPNDTVIALVTNWSTAEGWIQLPQNAALLGEATARAREYGYSLQHIWAREHSGEALALDRHLQARGIRGLLLAPPKDQEPEASLEWDNYATVCLGRPRLGVVRNFVEADHYHNLVQCVEKLIVRGRRRIGLALPSPDQSAPSHSRDLLQWIKGIAPVLGFSLVPELGLAGIPTPSVCRRWLERWRPEGIISSTPGLLPILQSSAPQLALNLDYVSLNTTDETPGVPGIDPHLALIGSAAIDLLHRQFMQAQCATPAAALGTRVCGTWSDGASNRTSRQGGPSTGFTLLPSGRLCALNTSSAA